ncbi:MAG TPA: hypothetical protein PL042_01680 [Caldisericia bacterium]|nr:hypothetical protein [Caldisericia bacterium]
MGKDIINIRIDSEWVDNFKRNYPKENLSQFIRELLYKHCPIDSKGLKDKRYRELIAKANLLSAKEKELRIEQDENNLLIEEYSKSLKE